MVGRPLRKSRFTPRGSAADWTSSAVAVPDPTGVAGLNVESDQPGLGFERTKKRVQGLECATGAARGVTARRVHEHEQAVAAFRDRRGA